MSFNIGPKVLIALRSLKELRKKFLQSEALKKKCCLSESSSEFISFSETAKKFSSSFGEHASFGSFLILRKEQEINNYRKEILC